LPGFAALSGTPNAGAQGTVRAVMHSGPEDPGSDLDDGVHPAQLRLHGLDTLFATDADGQVKPQMIEHYEVSPTSCPTR
jgi:hypothetical protein